MKATRLPRLVSAALIALLASCSTSAPLTVEKLDPLTGVTVLRATKPIVLYRDNSAYAAHARDYVNIGPIEVNRMGTRDYFLWLGIWGTMRDDARLFRERDGFESIVLYADGEPLSLEIEGWTFESIGVSEPVYLKPVAGAADAYYRVTADQIRLLTTASDIVLRTGLVRSASYGLWDEQALPNASFKAFLDTAYD